MGAVAGCADATKDQELSYATPVLESLSGGPNVAKPSMTPTSRPDPTPTFAPPSDLNQGVLFANRGDPEEAKLAITIDDFAYPQVVADQLWPMLRKNPDLKLTLFPIGDRIPVVENVNPGFWRWALEQGHEIGFHSMHHDDLGQATADDLLAEVLQFNHAVGLAVGDASFRARYGRPPYGNYGDRTQFVQVGAQSGMTWILWSTVPSSADALSLALPEAITPGDVALFHVRWQDMAKLQPYLDACRKRGLEFVTLSHMRLISSTKPTATPF